MIKIQNIAKISQARRTLVDILKQLDKGEISDSKAKTMTYIIRTIMDALVIEKDMDIDKKSNNGASQVLKSIVAEIKLK